jgi:3-dehydroquinate synthetase
MKQNNTAISVGLAERSYDIHIGSGLIDNADTYAAPFTADRHLVIITDDNVGAAHGERLKAGLVNSARKIDSLHVPAGEASKSLLVYGRLLDDILALGVDRSTVIIAFGGGVIGDLAGYVAASLLRGVDFIQVPTSLLAQVDSSVGGKTGINMSAGKNLVGAFHQPKLVLADTDILATLPERELRAGYAEIVKYGLLGDAEFFEWLEAHGQNVLARDEAAIAYAVYASCRAKADIVAADEREGGCGPCLILVIHLLTPSKPRQGMMVACYMAKPSAQALAWRLGFHAISALFRGRMKCVSKPISKP